MACAVATQALTRRRAQRRVDQHGGGCFRINRGLFRVKKVRQHDRAFFEEQELVSEG